MYFNYHAKIKKLITENHLIDVLYAANFNNISPAIIFFFDNHKPMPIREYRFKEYLDFLAVASKNNKQYKILLNKFNNEINSHCNYN